MFNISPLEITVLLVIALIVLGPQRLPDMARSVGRGMREFRAALSSDHDDDHDDDDDADDDADDDDPERR
jgi:sec-independent protein translocase protein TatA